jgi:hypothetical protein
VGSLGFVVKLITFCAPRLVYSEVPDRSQGIWRWPGSLIAERNGTMVVIVHGTTSNLGWRVNFK